MPTVPTCKRVNKKWHEPGNAENSARDFQFVASAYFAVDPAELFAELVIKHAAFQEHSSAQEKAIKATGNR